MSGLSKFKKTVSKNKNKLINIATRVGMIVLASSFLTLTTAVAYRYYNYNRDKSPLRFEKTQIAYTTKTIQEKEGKTYSLIIGSSYWDWDDGHRKNIDFARESMIKAGISKENIYVLYGKENRPYYSKAHSSKKTIENIVDELSRKLGQNDKLLLFVNADGEKKYFFFGDTIIKLDEGFISSSQLRTMFNKLNLNYLVAIFQVCQGYDFALKFSKDNFIGISASRKGKYAAASNWYSGKDGFTINFFSALGSKDSEGNDVNADINSDSRTSIEEMFEYAAINSPQTDVHKNPPLKITPQLIWQNSNPSKLYLN